MGSPDWWRRFEYLAERARGLEYQEDLWTPGIFEVPVDGGAPLPGGRRRQAPHRRSRGPPRGRPARRAPRRGSGVTMGAERPDPRSGRPPNPRRARPCARRLTVAAEAFRADLARRPGVIAGYPWFEVWGRDTLAHRAPRALSRAGQDRRCAAHPPRRSIGVMAEGLVPKTASPTRPGDARQVHTRRRHAVASSRRRGHVADAARRPPPFRHRRAHPGALRDAFEAALRGTRDRIHITAEGLFAAGNPGDSLTWMDARVTTAGPSHPARGAPLNARSLWARGAATRWRASPAPPATPSSPRAPAPSAIGARRGFQARFWCAATDYPYDVVSRGAGRARDRSATPPCAPTRCSRSRSIPTPSPPRRPTPASSRARAIDPGDAGRPAHARARPSRATPGVARAAWRPATAPTTRARCGPWLLSAYVRAAPAPGR